MSGGLVGINKQYRKNYKKGMRVYVDGQPGEIVGSKDGFLKILIDGATGPTTHHPALRIQCAVSLGSTAKVSKNP